MPCNNPVTDSIDHGNTNPSTREASVGKRPVDLLKLEEQRRSARYLLELTLQFKSSYRRKTVVSGTGRTLDISSSGLLFVSDQQLKPGMKVELSINWPVKLHGETALQLVVRGIVVRVVGSATAIRMKQRDFHTRRTVPEKYAECGLLAPA
jgi:hypothetical protein